MKNKLAINGGKPVLKGQLPEVYNIDKKEISAVNKVLKSGSLSGFVGAKGPFFLGGPNVRRTEKLFSKKFKVKHAVTFNSATTALHAAVVALGIGPGDEVIVSPYTMAASATAILMNGAVPIFADIDPKTFCIDPVSVKRNITPRTKAIMVVNIFGGPANFDELLKIAKEHNLKIIEDNAQSPGAKYKGKLTGTIGDIGILSLNFHKVIQSGEGGVLITNNDNYALRAQMSRNHGEIYADQSPEQDFGPIMGSNYRMTEIEAAIAYEQLLKLDFLNKKRIELADYLTKKLKIFDVLVSPYVEKGNKHVYYLYPIKIDEAKLGVTRADFVKTMTAEGMPLYSSYVKPIYLLKLFQEKKAFNNTKFPFEGSHYSGSPDYSEGICPVTEQMYDNELVFTNICQYPRTKKHIDMFVSAVKKIVGNKK